MEALPRELILEEIAPSLDLATRISLALACSAFYPHIPSPLSDFAKNSEENQWKFWARLCDVDPKVLDLGALHPAVHLLSSTLFHPTLFRFLLSNLGLKTRFSYQDCQIVSYLILSTCQVDLLDTFLNLEPKTHLFLDTIVTGIPETSLFARCLGASGNLDLIKKSLGFHKFEWERVDSLINIAIGAAQFGRVEVLEWEDVGVLLTWPESAGLTFFTCIESACKGGNRAALEWLHAQDPEKFLRALLERNDVFIAPSLSLLDFLFSLVPKNNVVKLEMQLMVGWANAGSEDLLKYGLEKGFFYDFNRCLSLSLERGNFDSMKSLIQKNGVPLSKIPINPFDVARCGNPEIISYCFEENWKTDRVTSLTSFLDEYMAWIPDEELKWLILKGYDLTDLVFTHGMWEKFPRNPKCDLELVRLVDEKIEPLNSLGDMQCFIDSRISPGDHAALKWCGNFIPTEPFSKAENWDLLKWLKSAAMVGSVQTIQFLMNLGGQLSNGMLEKIVQVAIYKGQANLLRYLWMEADDRTVKFISSLKGDLDFEISLWNEMGKLSSGPTRGEIYTGLEWLVSNGFMRITNETLSRMDEYGRKGVHGKTVVCIGYVADFIKSQLEVSELNE